jgi:inhibitor of KinA sporulation pathway (predicted exonuclease)
MGMDRMLQHIGEKLEGRHHNGADDAANIAKIVRKVLA